MFYNSTHHSGQKQNKKVSKPSEVFPVFCSAQNFNEHHQQARCVQR
jgi:hypothetical protein